MKIGETDVEIKWLGHSSFLIKDSKTIYIDPYNISDNIAREKADIILITHVIKPPFNSLVFITFLFFQRKV